VGSCPIHSTAYMSHPTRTPWYTMGFKDIMSPIRAISEGLPVNIGKTLKKYRIIYIGYVVSMIIFVITSIFEVFDTPQVLMYLDAYNLDKILFATMMFSVFMIVYFVREQEKMKYQAHIEEKERVKEGIWIAEQEIRNQIILINQATYIAEKKKDLDMDMIKIIRENTKKMEKQLELLQKSDVDPRNFDSFSEATILANE
jgi:hypothetical protein